MRAGKYCFILIMITRELRSRTGTWRKIELGNVRWGGEFRCNNHQTKQCNALSSHNIRKYEGRGERGGLQTHSRVTIKQNKLNGKIILFYLFAERVYQCTCWTSWSPDGQRLLGALLPGARHPARWHHAQRQDHRGPGRQLQHLLL